MINLYFPLYFWLSLFSYSKHFSLFYFLGLGFFLDCVVYHFPFFHTCFFLFCYAFCFFLKQPLNRKDVFWRMLMVFHLYFFLLYLFTQTFCFPLYVSQLVWNTLLVQILYEKERIQVKKSRHKYVIILS